MISSLVRKGLWLQTPGSTEVSPGIFFFFTFQAIRTFCLGKKFMQKQEPTFINRCKMNSIARDINNNIEHFSSGNEICGVK